MQTRLSLFGTLFLPLLASAPAHAQALAGPPLNAKVQETLMGPATQRVVLSPDGDHLAIVAPKGSRTVVLLDGVEGPVFDEIPLNFLWATSRISPGSMVFSATGGHSAYVGRRGGDFISVVDGKEAVTLSTSAWLQGGYAQAAGWGFFFNRDGSRLAYGALTGPNSWVMVVDGVKSPAYRAIDFTQTALNGKRLIYVAQSEDQQWHAVVDGKPGLGYAAITALRVTPNGLHSAYIGAKSGVGTRSSTVVNDGVESPMYYGVANLEQAPDGRIAYVGVTNPGDARGRGGVANLYAAGMTAPVGLSFNVSTYDKDRIGFRTGSDRHMVAWSADGKRVAYVQPNTPNPGVTAMVNGKPMGPTYLTADELLWSPDGAHLTYQGNSPTGTFAVVDGQEFGPYTWVNNFQWSSDGKRYAFQAASATGAIVMVVDGKEQPKTRGLVDGSIQWSPDGKHLAYGANAGMTADQPIVDGVAKPHNLQQFSTQNNPKILFPILSWSPDGNRIAYVGITMDQLPKAGVVVDGTLYPGPSAGFQFPSWSPNSNHFATVVWGGRGWTIMVDGKLGPFYENMVVLSSGACRFIDDHTFRFYGIKAGQIHRVTLDLGV
jgi:hypothetical protein